MSAAIEPSPDPFIIDVPGMFGQPLLVSNSTSSDDHDGGNGNGDDHDDEPLGLIYCFVTLACVLVVIDIAYKIVSQHRNNRIAAEGLRRRNERLDEDREREEREREVERVARQEERRAWYEYYMKPFSMVRKILKINQCM